MILWLLILVCNCFSGYAIEDKKEKDEEKKTLKKGNLALTPSQQPGPLIGFGDNVIDKDQVQLSLTLDDFSGRGKHFNDAIPNLNYGVSDQLSFLFVVPYALDYKDKHSHSDGFEDVLMQLEYAYFIKEETCFVDSATIVANVSFPTGSIEKDPPTGIGTAGFFIGATYNHTAIDWFYFTSYGADFSGTKDKSKIGNIYLYQLGFGKNIWYSDHSIFSWMVEIDGFYNEHNKIHGVRDPNSGGNVIYATPSLWYSTDQLIVQLGLGYAIQQNLFGDQGQSRYLLALNLGWTF